MRSIRRSGVTALTATIALVIPVGAITVGLGPLDSGHTTTLESATTLNPPYGSAGNLTLTTSATSGSITRYDATGTVVGTAQALTPGVDCLLTTNGRLLGITGNFTGASFASGSIGVAEKKSGQSCSQVGVPGEVLTLALSSSVKTDPANPTNPTLMESAALDIEAKQSARIVATAYNETTKVGVFELQSGTTSNSDPLDPTATVFPCSSSADSGPDSGANDNCRWTIARPGVVFTSLTLEVKNGSFSLEGGADGPGTEPSVFELVRADGILGCVDTAAISGDETLSVLRDFTTGNPRVQVRRLGNASTAETCQLVPYTLTNGSRVAKYYKPLDSQTTAQFIVDLTWRFDVTQYPTAADLPATTIDFELKRDPSGAIVPRPKAMGWCPRPDYTTRDGKSVFNGVKFPLGRTTAPTISAVPDMAVLADGDNTQVIQYACFGTREAKLLPGGTTYELHEEVYLLGDAAWRP